MDDITLKAMQKALKDVKNQMQPKVYTLFQKALKFLMKIEEITQKYDNAQNMLTAEVPLSKVTELMQHNQQALTELILAQYTFEEDVNKFLERKIHLAWADNQGNIFFTTEARAKKIYATAQTTSSKINKGQITVTKSIQSELTKKMTKTPSFLEKELREKIKKRIAQHQALYKTILQREQNNKKETVKDSAGKKIPNPYYKDHKKEVYWIPGPAGKKNSKKWAWSDSVSTEGHLTEQYINFIFNEVESLDQMNIEDGIGTFMMKYYNAKQDKIPGIVKGDVVVQATNGSVQIAVKSSDLFETASISSYIRVAYEIILFFQHFNDLTPENLQKVLDGVGGYNKQVVGKAQKYAKKVIEGTAQITGAKVS